MPVYAEHFVVCCLLAFINTIEVDHEQFERRYFGGFTNSCCGRFHSLQRAGGRQFTRLNIIKTCTIVRTKFNFFYSGQVTSMQASSKQTLIQIVLIIIVIAMAYYVFSEPEQPEKRQDTSVKHEQEQVNLVPEVVDEKGLELSEPALVESSQSTSKRIKHVPDTRVSSYKADVDDAYDDTNWENEYDANMTLESALSGNVDATIAVGVLVGQCRAGYDNERVVQSGIDRMTQSAKQGKPLPGLFLGGTGETRHFKSPAEYETFVWDQYAQCQSARGMFDKGLRDRLLQMAEGGNVTARYLYAMWIPAQLASNNDDLVAWMTYQSHAMDFTWQNIRAGEPLGLLAYGQSLVQSGHVYFTPPHMRYGPAFIMAAHKCGLDNSTLNQKVGKMNDMWKKRDMGQISNRANSMSDMLAKTFCH